MSRLPSVMSHTFSQVPQAEIPRSSFDRSHGVKTAFDAGYLVPIYVDEALPGDTFNLKLNAFGRLATPQTPFMDNLYMDFHFWAVPIRLIDDNWQKLNGEQKNPSDSTDYIVPEITSPVGGYAVQSLSDYFGIPPLVANLTTMSYFHRAYNLTWNEQYRDQNLQNSVPVPTGAGPDNPNDYKLLRRGKRHDYFTSSLPWPQKGPSVDLPLGSTAPVTGIYAMSGASYPAGPAVTSWPAAGPSIPANSIAGNPTAAGNNFYIQMGSTGVASATNRPQIFADLSDATAATINELRQAFQMQKLYERDARGGTRYTEIIKSHFGVTSPDARMQRPEYLGGGTTPININPIAQTSSTDATTPQGNLAAMGTVSAHGVGFTKSFTEHCVILGLVSVRADLTYQQGLNRMFSRSTRWDFYWPALSHLGEQAVLLKEIYAKGTSADETVFGYQERYAEYRYKPSIITGKMRSDDPQSLDVWHLSQDFGSAPALNAQFIEENPPMARVIAVTDEPHFIFDAYINLKCARPMPVYSVPGLIDHF